MPDSRAIGHREPGVSSLRERQKEDRSRRIAGAARVLFKQKGYDPTTIENIAEAAGVSGVTVHNYYGTKAGLLLALVVESDQALVERLEAELPAVPEDVMAMVAQFNRIMLDHAMSYLEKSIWRQVIAAVTLGAGTHLASDYAELDRRLGRVLVERVAAMKAAGRLPATLDAQHLGTALFQLANARFVDFVRDEDCTMEAADQMLANDLAALFAVCTGLGA